MASTELTISEALRDPMIGLMLRADRVSLRDFAKLLEEAARARNQIANSANNFKPVGRHQPPLSNAH